MRNHRRVNLALVNKIANQLLVVFVVSAKIKSEHLATKIVAPCRLLRNSTFSAPQTLKICYP